MTITRPCYASRELVKRALDYKETARSDGQVDRAIEAASDAVDGQLHRRFYPELATRYFDWPYAGGSRSWRLWLDANELISVETLTSGGVTLTEGTDFFLRRADDRDEPPYTQVQINLAGDATFGGGDTYQRDIAIYGLYGHSANEARAGSLAAALDATTTSVDITDAGLVGVGDLIRVGTERMLVTGRRMLTTGQTLTSDLTASAAGTIVPVSDGDAYGVDEVVLIDGERMLIVDIAGDDLIVKRAWDGSTLAAHTSGATVYAARRLTIDRGVLGTTAATHAQGDAVARHVPPALVRDLGAAEAIEQLLQEPAGYARASTTRNASTSTSTDRTSTPQYGVGLDALRARTYTAYGRKARTKAV